MDDRLYLELMCTYGKKGWLITMTIISARISEMCQQQTRLMKVSYGLGHLTDLLCKLINVKVFLMEMQMYESKPFVDSN